MEFKKERVYSAVNADELKSGDKVITANCMADLKTWAQSNDNAREILLIHDDTNLARFEVKGSSGSYISALAYLVERKENCTNCGEGKWDAEHPELTKCCNYKRYECSEYKPITKQKAKKHYRPFKDVDELIKVWEQKWSEKTNGQKWQKRELTMPYIWVKKHDDTDRGKLIISFSNNGCSVIDVDEIEVLLWEDLFNIYTFLDGSPCGVEE